MRADSKLLASHQFTVSTLRGILSGSAQEILQVIFDRASDESPVKSLSGVEEYAATLVDNAESLVPKDALKFLRRQKYDSEYDQALHYLAAMPSSSVRILQVKAD